MSESLSFLFFIFWYRSLPRGVAVFCLSMRLSLCVILSDCLSTDFAGGQTGRQAGEAGLAVRVKGGGRSVVVREGWSSGCSITASPEWGSRCKALIAPQSLSLLCDRPLQSCPLPRQLQRDTACATEGEKRKEQIERGMG